MSLYRSTTAFIVYQLGLGTLSYMYSLNGMHSYNR